MKTAARPAQHLVLLVSLSWQGCTGASEEAGEKPQIRPRLEECSLEAAGRALKPAGPRLRAGQADGGGELWLSVQGDSVTALSRTRGEPLWTARSADGSQLAWLGSGGGVLYLVGYRTDPQAGQQVQVSPHRVARLDLKSGKWLESLVLGTEGGTQPPERTVLEVLAGEEDEEHVLVLSSLARPAPDQREPSVSAYEVACFRAGEVRPLWSRTFAAEGERPYTGGYLWAPRTPQYAASALQRLVRLEETVLVAPEAVQPIRCLSAATGTELWRVERPWELQRGFVGPSVWSHHIGRFGIWRHLSATDAESREAEATARASFDRMFRCAVVGGPVLVPRKGARAGTHSIFLAVSRGPREGFTGYLSDCILHELSDRGEPLSLCVVPQMIQGALFKVQEDGVVWRCQNDGFLKALPSAEDISLGMGPGGPDLLTRLAWFRQSVPPPVEAKLSADRSGDPVAFSATHAFCVPAGGYITRDEPQVYRFPLAAVELSSGSEHPFLLKVPFDGEVGRPENHRSERDGQLRIKGPYLLAVTGLQVEGTDLLVTLGREDGADVLRFDLRDLGLPAAAARPLATAKPAVDPAAVNRRDEDGSTPLIAVAGRGQPDLVQALLEAGADVRARSRTGWTALMKAALYGDARTVELLVAAGAVLEARDENHDRKNALLWAAWSSGQSQRKVELLLKAGADPKATNESGWNALMIAAQAGNLTTVEHLLAAGFDVAHRSRDGRTALMVSGGHGEAAGTLADVLLRAGADPNATDGEGRTALLHAAPDGSPEKVAALLRADADLAAKDKSGRTALDAARASNQARAGEVVKLLEEALRRRAGGGR